MKKGNNIYRGVVYLILCLIVISMFLRCKDLIGRKIHSVFRTVEGFKIDNRVSRYEKNEIDDFILYYNSPDISIINKTEDIIRKYGSKVLSFFDFTPDRIIEVMLFKNEKELHSTFNIPRSKPTLGAYSGGKIALLAYSDGGNAPNGLLINTFVHELTHLVVDELAGGNFPLWFTEGSALYMEYELLGYEWGWELGEENFYSMEDLTKGFNKLDEYQAYRQAFIYVRDIIENIGKDSLLEIFSKLKNGEDSLDRILTTMD